MLIVYWSIGSLFSAVYCLLAGWSDIAFFWGFFLSPILISHWLRLMVDAYIIVSDNQGIRFNNKFYTYSKKSLITLCIYTLYLSLPVLLRISSVWASKMGSESLSNILYEQRYLSLVYGFSIFVILMTLWSPLKNFYIKKLRKTINFFISR
jgi:hypothetical protein